MRIEDPTLRLAWLGAGAALAVAIAACLPSMSASPRSAAGGSSSRPSSSAPASQNDPDQKIADLGTCALESGERIEGCRIGYRTYGVLDATKSNAILFPTWFSGTTKALTTVVPDKLVDTQRFYLILVDAIGDGVSTSPSNSAAQPRLAFPRFTVGDMIASQKRLVTEVLGIPRLRAVMGISMGGMQAIEWAVQHPELVDRVVSIVGSPQLTSNDLLLWRAELNALTSDVAYVNGNYRGRPPMRAVRDLHQLALTTPAHRAGETSREAFAEWAAQVESDVSFDWNDWRRQLEAMMTHDVARAYQGSLEAAASRVEAKALFAVADQDHMVSPIPARRFARAMGARATLVSLDGPCGHAAPTCESAKLSRAIMSFLAQ